MFTGENFLFWKQNLFAYESCSRDQNIGAIMWMLWDVTFPYVQTES